MTILSISNRRVNVKLQHYNYVNINKSVKNITAKRHVSSASVTYRVIMEIQIDY